MQGELTSRLSSSWMYIAYTPLLFWFMQKERKILFYIFSVCTPLLMNWPKRGEKFEVCIYACLFYLLPFTIGIKIGIKSMFISLVSNIIFMHIYVKHSLHIFTVYCYAWVNGELLWSLTLIHAYITPWVLSSSKGRRLLAQRPFTLVLMMINSCSYVY